MNHEIEVIDADKTSNHAAMHSIMVMEQWGNGETYDEATWIERGRHAVRQTMEGMFELGRALIVLKEHTEHGRFTEIVKTQFGIDKSAAARLMSATQRFATPQMQKAQAKLMDLGKSKLLELLVEEDVTLVGLAEGEEVNGATLDDIDRMTVRELRLHLRENREQLAAKDKVLGDKNAKIDELAEKLEKSKKKSSLKLSGCLKAFQPSRRFNRAKVSTSFWWISASTTITCAACSSKASFNSGNSIAALPAE